MQRSQPKPLKPFLFTLFLSGVCLSNFAQQIGINTDGSTPTMMLDVKTSPSASSDGIRINNPNTSNGDAILNFQNNGSNIWTIGFDDSDSDKLKFANSGAVATNTRVTIETNGDVGIGVSNPSHKLHIVNSSSDNVLRLVGPDAFGHGARLNFGDGNGVFLDEYTNNNLEIYASGSTRITGGNVTIGRHLYISNERRIYPLPGGNYARIGASNNAFQDIYTRYSFVSTGYTVSDSSKKIEIAPLSQQFNATDKLMELTPKSYKWNLNQLYWQGASAICTADTTTRFGFIAQDVQRILPNATTTLEDGTIAINMDALVAVLFQAVRELTNEVEELKNR
jgi:hypothetical protein